MRGIQSKIFLILLLALCACKPQKAQNEDEGLGGLDYTPRQNGTPTGRDPFGSGGDNTNNPNVVAVGTETGAAPLKYTIRGIGYDAVTEIPVNTRGTLKVVFIPETQDRKVAGTQFSPQYSTLGVNIAVNDDESGQFTPVLRNGAESGYPQQASAILDVSVDPCPDDDLACVRTAKIKISRPNYNYWLFQWGQYCFSNPKAEDPLDRFYCTDHTHVYKTHPWRGTLWIQTSYTRALRAGLNP